MIKTKNNIQIISILLLSIFVFLTQAHLDNEKIVSIYGGYSLERDSIEQVCKEYIEPVANAGFNTIELKILVNGKIDRNNPDQIRRLKELCSAVEKKGMSLMCYTFANPWNGKRQLPKDEKLPVFVNEDGLVIDDKFPLVHWSVFEMLMCNAFELAYLSKELPIDAVKIDIETIHNLGISYDDVSWKKYAGEKDFDNSLSIQDRLVFLKQRQLKDDYVQWFQQQMLDIAVRFEKKMHQINPELTLGFMPAHGGWFYEAFLKKISTKCKPAIMDSWLLYNINGFSDEVLKEQAFVKNLNEYNIYVPWFRLNNYYPEDIGIQAYHTAMNCDGYSGWVLTMLKKNQQDLSNFHKLPQPATPDQYYQAFSRANKAIASDVSSGKKVFDTIAFKKGRSVAPPILGVQSIKPPVLIPISTTKVEGQAISLRGQQQFDIFANAGDVIKIEVKHLAGQRRAIALHYALIDSQKRELRHETISPSAKEVIEVTAPETGSYRFVITGGEAGMAWYSVKVFNPNSALKLPAYVFFMQNCDFWLRRTSLDIDAKVTIKTNGNQLIEVRLNDGENVSGDGEMPINIELSNTMKPQKLTLLKPKDIPQGKYVQDYLISVSGAVEPYLYDGIQRGVSQDNRSFINGNKGNL